MTQDAPAPPAWPYCQTQHVVPGLTLPRLWPVSTSTGNMYTTPTMNQHHHCPSYTTPNHHPKQLLTTTTTTQQLSLLSTRLTC